MNEPTFTCDAFLSRSAKDKAMVRVIIIFSEDDPGMGVETSDITKNSHNTA